MIKDDIAVISCFYNFKNYNAPKRNLARWKRQIDLLGIPNYGVELSLCPYDFVLECKNWENLRSFTNKVILFQKEALLNKVEKIVPEKYKKIIICDSDVWFDSLDWADRTSEKLDEVKVCSPFENCFWTNPDGSIFKSAKSFGYNPNGMIGWSSHPGFALAFRRDFWSEVGGLYPYCISGSGDSANCAGLADLQLNFFSTSYGECSEYLTWYEKAKKWCNGSIGHIKGNCYHEYHGNWKDKQYSDRHKFSRFLDPLIHLKFNNNNYLEWTEKAPEQFKQHIINYFMDRNEDRELNDLPHNPKISDLTKNSKINTNEPFLKENKKLR